MRHHKSSRQRSAFLDRPARWWLTGKKTFARVPSGHSVGGNVAVFVLRDGAEVLALLRGIIPNEGRGRSLRQVLRVPQAVEVCPAQEGTGQGTREMRMHRTGTYTSARAFGAEYWVRVKGFPARMRSPT